MTSTTATGQPLHAVAPVQGSFDELGRALRETTFVVVDLETTGGSARTEAITEIGAVKVRGGQVLGTFQTLVDPGRAIPAFVSVLTGITDAMVVGQPRIAQVLPAFLEFARGTVLVAHNAPFDLGFLRQACVTVGTEWPGFDSLDTARIARRVLQRDEAPNCKLATLAQLFRTEVRPTHRALDDAQATVDVLHALIGRLGSLGVSTVEELATFTSRISEAQRRKRHLAESLPHAPGVYLFRDERERVLYIGTSGDLRRRVQQYFRASEPRTRMREMVGVAARVDHVRCAHALEAQVRELRLIAAHQPRYNRRSLFPDRLYWLKLTQEPFPRLSAVATLRDDGATYLGPWTTSGEREQARAALLAAVPLRQCGGRLSTKGTGSACALAEMGRCGAPCDGRQSREQYAELVAQVQAFGDGHAQQVATVSLRRIAELAAQERFEPAGAHRDRLVSLLRAARRRDRVAALSALPHLVGGRPDGHGGWELAVVAHGRLVAAGVADRGVPVRPYVAGLLAGAEVLPPARPGPLPVATLEETQCVLRWLEQPGSRLVELEGVWCSPADGAGAWGQVLDAPQTERGVLGWPKSLRPARPAGPAGPAGPVGPVGPAGMSGGGAPPRVPAGGRRPAPPRPGRPAGRQRTPLGQPGGFAPSPGPTPGAAPYPGAVDGQQPLPTILEVS